MRDYYKKTAKQLKSAIEQLDAIAETRNLAELHRFVVDLKTSLPERLAYENSPILLDGLRVTSVDDMPEYVKRLRERLQALHNEYQERSR